MVNRRVVRTDLRRSVISLSPAGLEILAKIAPLSEASFAEITRLFGEHQLDQLFGLLYELEHKLKKNSARESREAQELDGRPTLKRGRRSART